MARKFRLLHANEIDCRIGQIKVYKGEAKGLTLLLYKDARADMDLLDETVGPMNWRREHTRDNANCIVSIWDETKGVWVSKEDTGVESNTEAEKGLASDSFKRACVNWGIGRELYTAPFIWITPDRADIKTENDRGRCYDKFAVSKIEYSADESCITFLEIVNQTKRAVAFTFGKPNGAPNMGNQPATNTLLCECCGKRITGSRKKDGTEMTAEDVAESSIREYGKRMCIPCVKTRMKNDSKNN